MRITDVALSTATPVTSARPKRADNESSSSPTLARAAKTGAAPHPDEVAAAKLQKAAGAAQAARVVAAENQRASDSVRGDALDASKAVRV